MDITKWKSVLVPIDVYKSIKKQAKNEGRTISGQLQMMQKESDKLRELYPSDILDRSE